MNQIVRDNDGNITQIVLNSTSTKSGHYHIYFSGRCPSCNHIHMEDNNEIVEVVGIPTDAKECIDVADEDPIITKCKNCEKGWAEKGLKIRI